MDLFYCDCTKFNGANKKEKEHNAGRYIVEYVAKNIYKIENSETEVIYKKPKYKYSNICFSVTHSDNIALVCFDKNQVGVDIERIKPRDFQAVAKRMNFKLKENTLEEFYKEWTLYEAEIKLQESVRSSKTMKFNDNFILSIVSASENPIEFNYFLEIT